MLKLKYCHITQIFNSILSSVLGKWVQTAHMHFYRHSVAWPRLYPPCNGVSWGWGAVASPASRLRFWLLPPLLPFHASSLRGECSEHWAPQRAGGHWVSRSGVVRLSPSLTRIRSCPGVVQPSPLHATLPCISECIFSFILYSSFQKVHLFVIFVVVHEQSTD